MEIWHYHYSFERYMVDSCNHSFNNFVVSSMYYFPAFPDGIRNKFFFQYAASSYTVDTFASNT